MGSDNQYFSKFVELPNDLRKFEIIRYMDNYRLFKLSQINREYHSILSEDRIWILLIQRNHLISYRGLFPRSFYLLLNQNNISQEDLPQVLSDDEVIQPFLKVIEDRIPFFRLTRDKHTGFLTYSLSSPRFGIWISYNNHDKYLETLLEVKTASLFFTLSPSDLSKITKWVQRLIKDIKIINKRSELIPLTMEFITLFGLKYRIDVWNHCPTTLPEIEFPCFEKGAILLDKNYKF